MIKANAGKTRRRITFSNDGFAKDSPIDVE
jgi:hypothetical protein